MSRWAQIETYSSVSHRFGKSPYLWQMGSTLFINNQTTTHITMNYLKSVVRNFLKQEDGPTAVEYAIMLALIVLVCVAAIATVGESARGIFESVANGF